MTKVQTKNMNEFRLIKASIRVTHYVERKHYAIFLLCKLNPGPKRNWTGNDDRKNDYFLNLNTGGMNLNVIYCVMIKT